MDIIVNNHGSMYVSFQGLCEYMCLICINVLNLWTMFGLQPIKASTESLAKNKYEQETILYSFHRKTDHLVDSWILRDLSIVGTSNFVVLKIISVVRIPSETSISQDL